MTAVSKQLYLKVVAFSSCEITKDTAGLDPIERARNKKN